MNRASGIHGPAARNSAFKSAPPRSISEMVPGNPSAPAEAGGAVHPLGRKVVKSRAMRSATGGLVILCSLLVMAGCENPDGNEWQRLVCEVQSVNGGSPLVSGYLHAGADKIVGTDDDYQPIDIVQVVFHARPYGSTIMLPEDGAHSWFHVTHYDLEWETDAGAPDLSAHDIERGSTDAMVPVYEEGASSILTVGIDMKNAPWFVDVYTGDIPSFQANARLRFYGHESGSDEEIAIAAGLRVNFIGVIVED